MRRQLTDDVKNAGTVTSKRRLAYCCQCSIENGWSNAEIYPFHELGHEYTDFINVSFFLGKHQDTERTDDTETKPRRCFARLFVVKYDPVCASVDGKGDCLALSLMQAHGKKTGCGVRWQKGRNYEIRAAYGSSSWKTEYFIMYRLGNQDCFKKAFKNVKFVNGKKGDERGRIADDDHRNDSNVARSLSSSSLS